MLPAAQAMLNDHGWYNYRAFVLVHAVTLIILTQVTHEDIHDEADVTTPPMHDVIHVVYTEQQLPQTACNTCPKNNCLTKVPYIVSPK